jgi:HEAT repeat protein
LGTSLSVSALIPLLEDSHWEMRRLAYLNLCQMTAHDFGMEGKGGWETWWNQTTPRAVADTLLQELADEPAKPIGSERRLALVRALRHLASPPHEAALLSWAIRQGRIGLSRQERWFLAECLERVGSDKCIPVLPYLPPDAAAFALGRLGGPAAEKVLLGFPKTLAVLLNLDRMHSVSAGSFLPQLVSIFGLITYRGQPDDLHLEPQPVQRVAANLILRSGEAPLFIELVLRELEHSMKPPLNQEGGPEIPSAWKPMLVGMRDELKPGFVRGDGATTSQPLTALRFLVTDPGLVPRLRPLLQHPAVVPRIYVAMLLGDLNAVNALPDMVELVNRPYPFSDSTSLASGKHFDRSQNVRWKGFLCLAIARLKVPEARLHLEKWALDPKQSRDIRYGSVVGLGYRAESQSIPVLQQVAREDIIWMIRQSARETLQKLESSPHASDSVSAL